MSALIFLDTETTGLSLDDQIWEFAAIRREPDGSETRHHLFIDHDLDLAARLPESFRSDHDVRYDYSAASLMGDAAAFIHELTQDRPHIVGACPNFDTERLALLLRRFGFEPGWHYHLIDVENLAVGWLHARALEYPGSRAVDFLAKGLPWDSDALSHACDVEPPIEGRHTAMGDALWAMALYDAVTNGTGGLS